MKATIICILAPIKTKLILIVLMACFAIVGIAIIVSMVRKSKG